MGEWGGGWSQKIFLFVFDVGCDGAMRYRCRSSGSSLLPSTDSSGLVLLLYLAMSGPERVLDLQVVCEMFASMKTGVSRRSVSLA